ncbi:hypothetical protein [Oceanithermus sp.]
MAKNPGRSTTGSRCLGWLGAGSTLGFFFALLLGGVYLNVLSRQMLGPLFVYWAAVELVLAGGLLCVYRLSGEAKHAFGGMLLLGAAFFSLNAVFRFLPSLGLLETAVQALGLVAFSLLLYELGRQRPATGLEGAGGLIFLGVIFQILQAPLMEAAGVFLLAAGFLLASGRLMRL